MRRWSGGSTREHWEPASLGIGISDRMRRSDLSYGRLTLATVPRAGKCHVMRKGRLDHVMTLMTVNG